MKQKGMNKLETSWNERQDQVETRKERDEAETKILVKMENEAEMTNQKQMTNEENMATQQIQDAKGKKGRNALRNMKRRQ